MKDRSDAPSHHERALLPRSYISLVAAWRDCSIEELSHPPYYTDLAPGDFYLFTNLKEHLRAGMTMFKSGYRSKKKTPFYLSGIENLFTVTKSKNQVSSVLLSFLSNVGLGTFWSPLVRVYYKRVKHNHNSIINVHLRITWLWKDK